MMHLNIIGKRKVYLSISAIAVLLSIAVILLFGFRQGIDFRGGTLWRFTVGEKNPAPAELAETLTKELNLESVTVAFDRTSGAFLVRMPFAGDEEHGEYINAIGGLYPDFQELSFEAIGPSIGEKLRRNAFIAVGLVLVGISLFVAFAFRKASRPVSSWKYGIITLVTLFHDVIITAGVLAVMGKYAGVEIDSNFVVALLVVMGFSVHDTIVVFDRIRERIGAERGRGDFGVIVNDSVNQTLARSINTSVTLIVVLVSLYVVGPPTLTYFVLALLVGVTVGTYSSVFVASPFLFLAHPQSNR